MRSYSRAEPVWQKIYADFYRLSEDLDFVISMPLSSSRSERSKKATILKDIMDALPERLPGFRVVEPLTGANNSTQYNAIIGYPSRIAGQEETIKVEVGCASRCSCRRKRGWRKLFC